MKQRNISFFWCILTLSIFVLSGCVIGEKGKTKKISGTWQMMNTWDNSVTSAEDEYWQFDNGAFYRLLGLPPVKTTETAQYFIQQKLSKSMLTIDYGMDNGAVPNGTWEIIKLNKTELILERTAGGKILREFIKNEDQ